MIQKSAMVILGCVAGCMLSTTAFAAGPEYCVPEAVSWDKNYGARISIQCGSTAYWSHHNRSSCSGHNRGADTLKAWLSLGQAALLSGKRVKVYFANCGGMKLIESVTVLAD